MQHFYKVRVTVVHDLAAAQIQCGDLLHIFFTEHKVPDVQILLHAVLMHRLRNNDHTALQVTLFDREKNKITLNENGKIAVEYARRVLEPWNTHAVCWNRQTT